MAWTYETLTDLTRFTLNPLAISLIRFVLCTVGASTGASYFIDEPSDTYVENGKPAVLNCLTGGNIKSAIAWRRNGIFLDLAQDDRRMIKPNGSLYFSDIIHNEDEGTYQCEALSSNDMGLDYQILSRTARLIVAGKLDNMNVESLLDSGSFYDCITRRSLFSKKQK